MYIKLKVVFLLNYIITMQQLHRFIRKKENLAQRFFVLIDDSLMMMLQIGDTSSAL